MSVEHRNLRDAARYAAAVDVFTSEGGRQPSEDFSPHTTRKSLVAPTEADWALMAALGIQFDGRAFRFAGFRYDRLADAASSARLHSFISG